MKYLHHPSVFYILTVLTVLALLVGTLEWDSSQRRGPKIHPASYSSTSHPGSGQGASLFPYTLSGFA